MILCLWIYASTEQILRSTQSPIFPASPSLTDAKSIASIVLDQRGPLPTSKTSRLNTPLSNDSFKSPSMNRDAQFLKNAGLSGATADRADMYLMQRRILGKLSIRLLQKSLGHENLRSTKDNSSRKSTDVESASNETFKKLFGKIKVPLKEHQLMQALASLENAQTLYIVSITSCRDLNRLN